MVDCVVRVSSSRPHKRYKGLEVRSLDEKGVEGVCRGTDGRSIEYDESMLLNYRKKEAWDLLIEDVITFIAQNGVHGLHLDNGQSWPQILRPDV